MSIENARAFLNRIRNDEELRSRLEAAETKEERLKLAKAEGCGFTEDEWNEVRTELSVEDLDGSSGGSCSWNWECFGNSNYG